MPSSPPYPDTQAQVSLERLSISIESTPHVAVQWYDSDGRVRLWNQASESFYGYSSAEMMGRIPGSLILSDDSNRRFISAARTAS